MAKVSPIQNAFNAGEWSPKLKGRSDLAKYKNACAVLENFIPEVYGPASKRPGTRFVNEVKTASKKVRLISFEFSTTQAYILELGDQYMRFYMDGGVILSGGSPYEIATPYLEAELFDVHFTQSADVLYMAHPNHPPQKLSRLAHDSWTIADVVFDWPPFNSENVSATTITASAVTGAGITLTASAATFNANHVGTYFKLAEVISSKYDNWEAGKAITTGDKRVYGGNLYEASSTATTGARPPIHTKGTESDGGVNWDFLHDGAGYAEITAYTSTTVVTATVVKRLPDSSLTGTEKWSEGAWSDYRGWPKSLAFYEDRLWFAGSINKPQTLWASTSGDYENHKYGTNDDDALNYTINSQSVNTIEWMSPGKILAVGTSAGEFIVRASSLEEAITPTNVKITPQTTYGSASSQPLKIGNATLFTQRSGRKMRELAYQFERDAYVAPNLTILAEHILESGVADVAYQQEPHQIVWVVRNDGVLVGLTYERSEEAIGWHRQLIGGADVVVESVCSIPHWDGDQDVTFLAVKRTVDGGTVRYVEYIEKQLLDEYALFMDCALTYDSTPTTTISGLDHLEGETVTVLTDGYVHPDRIVSSGAITLQNAASVVSVGLKMTSYLETMPIDAGARDGTAQGKTVRVHNVTLKVNDAGPGLKYGPNRDQMDEVYLRTPSVPMGSPVPLFTGDTDILPWPEGYEVGAQIGVMHDLPLPCTIVAVMPQLVTNDR